MVVALWVCSYQNGSASGFLFKQHKYMSHVSHALDTGIIALLPTIPIKN